MCVMVAELVERIEARGLVTHQEVVDWLLPDRPPGSWWSHPRAKEVYDLLTALEEETDLLSCKLVQGKQTFVHRRLWPALVRVQREPALWPPPGPAAARLLGAVLARQEVQAKGPARLELERSLRVLAQSVHTERGHHEVLLTPFEAWVTDAVAREAETLSLEAAIAALADAGYAAGASARARAPKKESSPRKPSASRTAGRRRAPRR